MSLYKGTLNLYNIKDDEIDLSYSGIKYKNHIIKNQYCSGITKSKTHEWMHPDTGTVTPWVKLDTDHFMYYGTKCAKVLKMCNESDLIMDNLTVEYDRLHLEKFTISPVDHNTEPVDEMEKGTLMSLLNPEYNLYDYQVRDITWMQRIEDMVNNTLNSKQAFNGGVYANEVGLGKTLTLLTLIKSDFESPATKRRRNQYETNDEICNYKFSRGKRAGQYCSKAVKADENGQRDSLYCKEHNKRAFEGSRIITKKNTVDTVRMPSTSNATLVFCPTHLCNQWLEEVKKFFGTSIRTVLCVNRSVMASMSQDEIFGADLIIMPHSLMSEFKTTPIMNDFSQKCFTQPQEDDSLWKKIRFQRVIYDECHELKLKNIEYYKKIGISAKVVWCVSGTPFPMREKNYLAYLTLLTQHRPEKHAPTTWLDTDIDWELFRDHCRRNTKVKVQHELEHFQMTEDVRFLEFTDIERNIYESYKRSIHNIIKKELLQLCCDPELIEYTNKQIQQCDTLDDVSKVLLTSNETRLKQLEIRVTETKSVLQILNADADQYDPNSYLYIEFKNQLTIAKRNVTEAENKFNCQTRLVNYLRNSIEKLKSKEPKQQDQDPDANTDESEPECAVCLGEYENDVTLLNCGHIFCTDCFDMLGDAKNCPTCKFPIKNKIRYDRTVKETKKDLDKIDIDTEDDPDQQEIRELTEKLKSTKMAHIVTYIKKMQRANELLAKGQPPNKCVIFSQWDTLLHKIGKNLTNCEIKVEYCEGSVYKRKNSIKNFTKSIDTNVILLSSKNAASGLNLTEANTVILLEPVYGDKEYKENIENQAIGRVNRIGQKKDVNVVRFLIRDTIEEEIHNGTANFKDIRII